MCVVWTHSIYISYTCICVHKCVDPGGGSGVSSSKDTLYGYEFIALLPEVSAPDSVRYGTPLFVAVDAVPGHVIGTGTTDPRTLEGRVGRGPGGGKVSGTWTTCHSSTDGDALPYTACTLVIGTGTVLVHNK